MNFQDLIFRLERFWADQGCAIVQPYDMQVGAGTFHPETFFRALGTHPWKVAFVQPSRRPTDGRYAENPLRTQHYYQYQVILKPPPTDIQALYLTSLSAVGIHLKNHDIRFVEDDWESPTLGAWGVGWEVWLDSLEVTQFTYFQQVGGIDLEPICVELTYGLERIAMFLQERFNLFELEWKKGTLYGDIHRKREIEYCVYHFERSNVQINRHLFDRYVEEANRLLQQEGLLFPGYDVVLQLSHLFNVLDARNAFGTAERTSYMGKIRTFAIQCAELYLEKISQDEKTTFNRNRS